jgi:hypothetical protein
VPAVWPRRDLPVRQIHNSHHLIFELGILFTALAAGTSTCVFAKTINPIIYCYTHIQ